MKIIALFGIVLIAILFFSGCATETQNPPTQDSKPTEDPKTTPTPEEIPVEVPKTDTQNIIWKADGLITQNEYKNSKEFENGRFTTYWFNDDEYLYMGLKGQTSGWVSIGFEPTFAMQDSDMVFGWLRSGTPTVLDIYSTGAFGPHPPDQELGGTDDLIEAGGGEAGGFTIIEFKRKLNTGDKYDKSFAKAQNINIIWGLGSSDSLESPHTTTGSGTIKLD